MYKLFFILLLVPALAVATKPKPPEQNQRQDQDQMQEQWQQQVAKSDSKAMSKSDGGDASNNLNVSGDRVENNSSNVVLVPNNNTENCLRIWGISFGNSNGSGGIGYPHRSSACDYEQAADDAAAYGDHNLAWYWRCHKRNVYKPFKTKGVKKPDAVAACFEKMTSFIDAGTLAERNLELESRVAFLLKERGIDRKKCEESKDRIAEGCYK